MPDSRYHELRVQVQNASANEAGQRVWEADLILNGELVKSQQPTQNPYDTRQEQECAWYIEQHVSVAPFEISRAKEVESSLLSYASTLYKQAYLPEVIARIEADAFSLTIEIVDSATQSRETVQSLHWELLELPSLWPSKDISICVRRRTLSAKCPEHTRRRAFSEEQRSVKAGGLNILLVVARDYSKRDSSRDEVDPLLALSKLLEVKKEHERAESGLRLEIEVARPGTWSAFKEHLLRRPPGYFQIVHFDLHGRIEQPHGATRQAMLHFASAKHPGKLSAVLISSVADVLSEREVSSVVFNSCRSARADDIGDDANMAKILNQRGVQRVVAMSYKLLEIGAALFIKSFYEALLLEQQSMSASIQTARSCLRNDPIRKARFDLSRRILDWIVPVYFVTGENLEFSLQKPSEHTLQPAKGNSTEIRFIGRAFDMLSFEKVLIEKRIICMSGAMGVGKTRFVQYLGQVWRETGFAEAILYINMAEEKIRSSQALSEAILHQYHIISGDADSSTSLCRRDERDTVANSQELAIVLVRSRRSIVLLDGLHRTHSGNPTAITPESLYDAEQTDIDGFLKSLCSPADQSFKGEPPKLVLIARSPEAYRWDYHFQTLSPKTMFNLEALRFDDAMSLSTAILAEHGIDVLEWDHAKTASLEQLVSLMQFNPTALELCLIMASPSTVNWGNHFRNILTGRHKFVDPEVSVVSPAVTSALTEIWSMIEAVPHSWHPIWAWVSLFWHEGPQFTALLQTLQKLSIANDVNGIARVLKLPYDQGYLRLNSEGDVQWLHPLWTLAVRIWLQKQLHALPESTSINTLSSALGWGIKRLSGMRDRLLGAGVETDTHLEHIYKVFCPDITSSPTQQEYLGLYLELYLDTIEARGFAYAISMAVKGSEVAEAGSYYRLSMYNLCSALILCSRDNMNISKLRWPEETFMTGCSLSRVYSTAAEAAFCAACFEDFIAAYVDQNGGLAIPEESRFTVFFISNIVTALHRSEVPATRKRGKDLAAYTIAMVEASEVKYGPFEDDHVRLQQSVAYRYLALELMEAGQEDEADSTWQKMLDIDRSIFEPDQQSKRLLDNVSPQPTRTSPRADWAVANLAKTPEEAGSIRQKLQVTMPASNPLLARWYDVRKLLWPFLKILTKAKGQDRESNKEMEMIRQKLQTAFDEIQKVQAASGLIGLEKDKRWRLASVGEFQSLNSTSVLPQQLLRLEEAQMGGHWLESTTIHEDLLQKAVFRMAFEESFEHLESVLGIVRKEATTEREMSELANRREAFELFQKVADLSQSFDAAVRRRDAKEAEKIGRSIKRLLSEVPSTQSFANETTAMLVAIVESGVKISQFPEQPGSWGSEFEGRAQWETTMTQALSVPQKERQGVYSSRLGFDAARAKAIIAQQEQNWLEAKVHLDKMLQLHDRGFLNDQISHDELVRWARGNESLIELWRFRDAVDKARQEHNYDQACSLIGQCSKVDLGNHAEQDKEALVKKMYQEVERSNVVHMFDDIQALIVNNRFDEALATIQHLNRLREQKRFAHLKPEDQKQLDQTRQEKGLQVQCIIDNERGDHLNGFKNVMKLLTILEDPHHTPIDPRILHHWRSLQETFEVRFHRNEFADAQEKFEYERAEEHLVKMEEIVRRQKGRSEDQKLNSAVLVPESIAQCRLEFGMQVVIMERFGDTMGKAMIQRSRDMRK